MGADKALLRYEGEPLVERVARRLAVIAPEVVLASGTRPLGIGFVELEDAAPDVGPLGGIVAAARRYERNALAVAAVDMPFANPRLFELCLDAWDGEDAVVPHSARGPEPLHSVYFPSARPVLESSLAEGKLSLMDVLGELSVRTVGEREWSTVDPTGRFAWNLNAPEDLTWKP